MNTLSIIVAVANNNAIGKDNSLLWHISDDLKYFKRITSGHTVIMGLKTYNSLPVKPFPNRRNIVIADDKDVKIDGCEMAYSLEEAIALADKDKENFICGGGSIYRQFMPLCNKMYITKVLQDFDADTFFPEIDETIWHIASQSEIHTDEKSGLQFQFQVYTKS